MQLKRCDWRHMKVIGMFHGQQLVNELQALPLIHLTQQNVSEAIDDESTTLTREEWFSGLAAARMPWDDFCFLFEQPNKLQNAMLCHIQIIDKVTFKVKYLVGSYDSLENNPTPMITATINVIDAGEKGYFYEAKGIDVFNDAQFQGEYYKDIPNVQAQIVGKDEARRWVADTSRVALNQVSRFLKWLETSAYFPIETHAVEKRGGEHRRPKLGKKAKAEPWRRMDLPTIRYMNAFPVDPSVKRESKGGTHASPKAHQRKGTRRTLSHERYKNHPLYLIEKAIPVSPAWVGDKESIVLGTEYRVISKIDIEAKMKALANKT